MWPLVRSTNGRNEVQYPFLSSFDCLGFCSNLCDQRLKVRGFGSSGIEVPWLLVDFRAGRLVCLAEILPGISAI